MISNILLIFTLIVWPDYTPYVPDLEIQDGWWSQYAEEPTLWQIDYHDYQDEEVDGFIAVLDCDLVGQYAWIKVNNSPWQYVRAFDCLGSNGNLGWWTENNIIGEIGYYLAEKFGVAGQGGVKARLVWVE